MNRQSSAELAPAGVSPGTWSMVPDASTARFAVRDKLVTTVHGSFPVHSGTVVFGAEGRVSRARVQLDVAGVASGNTRRDRDLTTARFLDAAQHPLIVVEAVSIDTRRTGWHMTATLSARGATCPLALDVTPLAREGQQVHIKVTGRLDRTGLGIKVPTFIIGRYLDIEVEAVFEHI